MILPLGISTALLTGIELAACAAIAAAVTIVARWVFVVLATEDLEQGSEWRYDISRINELRRTDPLYRLFQPVIHWLARINRNIFHDGLPRMQREIQAAGLPRFWLAEEYLARMELVTAFLVPAYAYFFTDQFGLLGGALLTPTAALATVWFLRRRLAARAAQRLRMIKRRMPFLLDLLTLLMEAGATFLRALRQAVDEFHGHPVAEEFGRVLNDMNMGKTRAEAFEAMMRRLDDDEINSIVGSILQGEFLGTPLAHVFRTQADVLRIKRTQRAETVAGEAGVNMLLPGMLVMIATVLIILGPFLMNYMNFGLFLE